MAPNIDIQFIDIERPDIDLLNLSRAAELSTLQRYSIEEIGLTIVLTNDRHLIRLNRQYLGSDALTDVLAFPAGQVDPDRDVLYLGDVVISYAQALAQAQERGHSVEEELQLLVVHGVLHLMGFDHQLEQQKEKMWSVQRRILAQLGSTIQL